ncbi:AN1-type zinc finger protein 2B isoform X5 [Macaca fascicularis]|uniref:AN1-type zinc finger protein 2B isoform X5 n=1 Tax=Macaca fascicularis TaxID=9541 RepID=UPI0003AB713F
MWPTPSITVDLLTKRISRYLCALSVMCLCLWPEGSPLTVLWESTLTETVALIQHSKNIFTNKCERTGCRQREMMKLTCERCSRNFCIKHRHPLDHDCSGEGHPTSRAGLAAISRAQNMASTSTVPSPSRTIPSCPSPSRATTQSPSWTAPPVIALQNGLSEDEALQRALEMSLAETKPQVPSCQEEEDLALAQALSASEAEYQQQQGTQGEAARSSLEGRDKRE